MVNECIEILKNKTLDFEKEHLLVPPESSFHLETYYASLFPLMDVCLPAEMNNICVKNNVASFFVNKAFNDEVETAYFYVLYLDYFFESYIVTYNDFISLCAFLSCGISDFESIYTFKSFPRKFRKFLLAQLQKIFIKQKNIDEVVKHRSSWLRLGEKLHPSEYKVFSITNNFFNQIRNNNIKSFSSNLDLFYSHRQYKEYLELLATRPNEFAKRLNFLLCSEIPNNLIINKFDSVRYEIDTKHIVTLINYLKNRNISNVSLAKTHKHRMFIVLDKNNKYIYADIIYHLIQKSKEVLIARFSQLSEMGNVLIDSDLCKCSLPLKNSYFDFIPISHETKYIKVSVKNKANENHSFRLSYFSLEMSEKQELCSIFDIQKLLDKGISYVLVSTSNKNKLFFEYSELDENKIELLENEIPITCNSSFTLVALFDLISRKFIQLNMSITNKDRLTDLLNLCVNYEFYSLNQLFSAHSIARASSFNSLSCAEPEESYDTLFIHSGNSHKVKLSVNRIITEQDIPAMQKEFL